MHINGRDCMVVGFTSTYAISAYHHYCELKSWSHLEIPSENYILNLEYKLKLEAQVSLYRSPDINKPSACLHAEYI
jgi:hypothetical protein